MTASNSGIEKCGVTNSYIDTVNIVIVYDFYNKVMYCISQSIRYNIISYNCTCCISSIYRLCMYIIYSLHNMQLINMS